MTLRPYELTQGLPFPLGQVPFSSSVYHSHRPRRLFQLSLCPPPPSLPPLPFQRIKIPFSATLLLFLASTPLTFGRVLGPPPEPSPLSFGSQIHWGPVSSATPSPGFISIPLMIFGYTASEHMNYPPPNSFAVSSSRMQLPTNPLFFRTFKISPPPSFLSFLV